MTFAADLARVLRPFRVLENAVALVRLERPIFGVWGRPRRRLYAPSRRRVWRSRDWSSVDAVLAAIDAGGFEDAIAVRIAGDLAVVRLRLDSLGELSSPLSEIAVSLKGYAEQDGAELLVLVLGQVPPGGRSCGEGWRIQASGYVVLTGQRWENAPLAIARCQAQLDALCLGEFLVKAPKATGATEPGTDRGRRNTNLESRQPATLAETGITKKESASAQDDAAREDRIDTLIQRMGRPDGGDGGPRP